MIFSSAGTVRSGDARGDKKVFSAFIVHTVHLWFFINNFMVIQGGYTVKGEQWIVHPAAMTRK
ncbi:hypothetical protein B6B68_003787 [Salmonella enterica subsp. enterica serovar Java]|nr:hypothetical protein [Salmonella enterica]ECM7470427.1 hypothetical protein [Salmonella enterica subsp. enterica serovar Newport]EDX3004385.1 hypothetical protein [Salmonella enterica subsp. enterica serovar Java]HAE7664260.1 hypothetical protein [Salmonella enterica subsp. enterica serovar Saintpaul]